MTRWPRSTPETRSRSSRDPTPLWPWQPTEARPPPTPACAWWQPAYGWVLSGVARVPERERPRLRPHQQTVRTSIDLDPLDEGSGHGVEDIDLAVVAAREPQLRAVCGDPAHVRRPAAWNLPRRDVGEGCGIQDRDGARIAVADEHPPPLTVGVDAVSALAGGNETLHPLGARRDDPDPVAQHVGHQEPGAVRGQPHVLGHR